MNLFAIWLIAILLPMQAVAAVSMMYGEMPQRQHHHQALSTHSHEHHQDAGSRQTHTHPADPQSAGNPCAKCSACCAGLAFVSTAADLKHHLIVAGTVIDFIVPDFKSHISSGLERPPRFTLI